MADLFTEVLEKETKREFWDILARVDNLSSVNNTVSMLDLTEIVIHMRMEEINTHDAIYKLADLGETIRYKI